MSDRLCLRRSGGRKKKNGGRRKRKNGGRRKKRSEPPTRNEAFSS